VRLGAEQTLLDSCRERFSGAVTPERFGSKTGYILMDRQVAPSSPRQMQSGSGIPNTVSVAFGVPNADETSLIDPYSSDRMVFAGWPLADERFIVLGYGGTTLESEPIPPTVVQAIILPENWEKEDDLRFDLLVEKEATGEISREEEQELERLSDKRDRTVAQVSDEELSRERMRNRVLIKLQDLLKRNAPLFAKRA
jgi:hypothetical protein